MTISLESNTNVEPVVRNVTLTGFTDLMFDRYPGDNDTKLEWHQKVYLRPGTSELVIPATNITSFLSSHNTNSAPKRLRDARKFKKICNACLSYTMVTCPEGGQYIPILGKKDKVIEMGRPSADHDKKSGIYLHQSVAKLEKGIPNPKERPVVPCPWSIKFKLHIFPNSEIKEQEIFNLFSEGGVAIGIGTYRGVFGKFRVTEWSEA